MQQQLDDDDRPLLLLFAGSLPPTWSIAAASGWFSAWTRPYARGVRGFQPGLDSRDRVRHRLICGKGAGRGRVSRERATRVVGVGRGTRTSGVRQGARHACACHLRPSSDRQCRFGTSRRRRAGCPSPQASETGDLPVFVARSRHCRCHCRWRHCRRRRTSRQRHPVLSNPS